MPNALKQPFRLLQSSPISLCGSLLLVVTLTAGCGTGSKGEGPAGSQLAQKPQSLSSCSAGQISWSDPNSQTEICAGPWQTPCLAQDQNPACGLSGYQQMTCYNTCTYVASTGNLSYATTITGYKECDNGGYKPRCYTVFDSTCTDAANAYIANSSIPSQFKSGITYNWTQSTSGLTRTCNITFTNWPTVMTGQNAACGSYSCDDTTKPIYNSCLHEDDSCGTNTWRSYSAPGLSRSSASTALPYVKTGSQQSIACLTVDDMPMGNDAQAQQKYDALSSRLSQVPSLPVGTAPSGVDAQALRTQLIQRKKLLFELMGSQLTPAQQQNAMDLYVSDPYTSFDCVSKWVDSPATSACSAPAAAAQENGTLALCQVMTSPHVSISTAGVAADRCLNAASLLPNLQSTPTECAANTFRDMYVEQSSQLVTKLVGGYTHPIGDDGRLLEIQNRLALIDKWYSQVRQNVYADPALQTNLFGAVDRLLKAFWDAVYVTDAASVSLTTDADAEAARSSLVSKGFAADRQVLRAAFGAAGTVPMAKAPLLYLVGDGLTGLKDRLESVSVFHDMACHFKTCTGVPTRISALWGLLGSLHDGSLLLQQVNAAAGVPDWYDVFRQMQVQHSALEAAVQDAWGMPFDPTLLTATAPDNVPDPAKGLMAILKVGQARSNAYAANGLFAPTAVNEVKVGLNDDKVDRVSGILGSVIQQLDSSVSSYQSNRLQLVQGLISMMQNQSSQNSLQDRLTELQQQARDALNDLDGLRSSQTVDESRFGQFMDGLGQLLPAIAAQGQDLVKSEDTLSISAANARFVNGAISVPGVAVEKTPGSVYSVRLYAGERMNIQAVGQWSPSCALSKVKGPNNESIDIGTEAITGTEGYFVQYQNGGYHAVSDQTADSWGAFANGSVSSQTCGGFDFPIGPAILSNKLCTNLAIGAKLEHDGVHTENTGGETRSTLSFSRGIRSPYAPFPDQPTGSLLAVRMRAGGTTPADILATQVVQSPATSLFADQDSDVYLVVNDQVDSTNCPTPSSRALTVHAVRLTPASDAAQQLATAMVAAEKDLTDNSGAIIAQGRILPSQQAFLRSAAYQEVYSRCNCTSLSAYPESLRTLFDTWISKELVNIERQVEMANLERRFRDFYLQMDSVSSELSYAGANARLLALAPTWALRDLDGNQLRSQLDALEEIMVQWVDPLIRIRHPEVLSTFSSSDMDLLNALTNIDPLSSIVDVAQTAKQAAQAVNNRVQMARVVAPTQTYNTVIVSIPRQDKTITPSGYQTVDKATAQAVWNDILAGRNPAITIKPEYIYNPLGGIKVIPCNQAAPIVNSMALYVATKAPAAIQPYSIPVAISPEMVIPEVDSLQSWNFINGDYLGPAVQMFFGPYNTAGDKVESYWGTPGATGGNLVGTGISPFTSFHLELGSLSANYPSSTPGTLSTANPLYSADELLLALRLEPLAEPPGTTLPGVSNCQ